MYKFKELNPNLNKTLIGPRSAVKNNTNKVWQWQQNYNIS